MYVMTLAVCKKLTQWHALSSTCLDMLSIAIQSTKQADCDNNKPLIQPHRSSFR